MTDENIRKILKSTVSDYQNDTELENSIMDSIGQIEEPVFSRAKKNAGIGIRICLTANVLLFLSVFYNLMFTESADSQGFEKYSSSILIFLSFFLLLILNEFYASSKRAAYFSKG